MPRDDAAISLLDSGHVLVSGGEHGGAFDNNTAAAVDVFDLATNAWYETTPMTWPRSGHTTTLLGDGSVLAVGGWAFDYLDPFAVPYQPASEVGTAELHGPQQTRQRRESCRHRRLSEQRPFRRLSCVIGANHG